MDTNTHIFDIKLLQLSCDGKDMLEHIRVAYIKTSCLFRKISSAEIKVLNDCSDETTNSFKSLESLDIKTGKKLSIGYDKTPLFEGNITKLHLGIDNKEAYLSITAKQQAHQLTSNRKNTVFSNNTDKEIISKIVGKYGIKTEISDSETTHENLVQYNVSDWDFINMRAEANGLYIFTHLDTLYAKPLKIAAKGKTTLSYKNTIYDIDLEIDGKHDYSSYKTQYWDYNQQSMQEKFTTNGIALKTALSTQEKSNSALSPFDGKTAEQQLKAQQNRHRFARLQGSINTDSQFRLLPGDTIALKAISKQYDGLALVSGVEHTLQDNAWKTKVHIGINASPYKKLYDDIDSPAANDLLASPQGISTGLVEQIEDDPDNAYRILVKLPHFEDRTAHVWARMSHLYAGQQHGSFFIPEVGDEVIIGFINNNPIDAVILGSMYSKQKAALQTLEKENNIKGFYSREQLKVELNEDDKSLVLSTPGGNKVVLHEKDKKIQIEDLNGNSICLNEDGIELSSNKDITLKASQGDISIEANNINITSNMELKANASTKAELSSSGSTIVKGSMVQIN